MKNWSRTRNNLPTQDAISKLSLVPYSRNMELQTSKSKREIEKSLYELVESTEKEARVPVARAAYRRIQPPPSKALGRWEFRIPEPDPDGRPSAGIRQRVGLGPRGGDESLELGRPGRRGPHLERAAVAARLVLDDDCRAESLLEGLRPRRWRRPWRGRPRRRCAPRGASAARSRPRACSRASGARRIAARPPPGRPRLWP